jgi:2-hydroxychromene-2-carboxylate isomerase
MSQATKFISFLIDRGGVMTKVIDFYFDFISPFSYLADLKLPEIAKKHHTVIHYHPMDIPVA